MLTYCCAAARQAPSLRLQVPLSCMDTELTPWDTVQGSDSLSQYPLNPTAEGPSQENAECLAMASREAEIPRLNTDAEVQLTLEQIEAHTAYKKCGPASLSLSAGFFLGFVFLALVLSDTFPRVRYPIRDARQAEAFHRQWPNIVFMPAAIQMSQISFTTSSYDTAIMGQVWVYHSPKAQAERFNPKPGFPTAISSPTVTLSTQYNTSKFSGNGTVVMVYDFSATIRHPFDFQPYPFDADIISIQFTPNAPYKQSTATVWGIAWVAVVHLRGQEAQGRLQKLLPKRLPGLQKWVGARSGGCKTVGGLLGVDRSGQTETNCD